MKNGYAMNVAAFMTPKTKRISVVKNRKNIMKTNIEKKFTNREKILLNRDEFFKKAFTDFVTRKPCKIPENIKNASIQICKAYNINGICDPMYIANIIAKELNLGDGKNNFI